MGMQSEKEALIDWLSPLADFRRSSNDMARRIVLGSSLCSALGTEGLFTGQATSGPARLILPPNELLSFHWFGEGIAWFLLHLLFI